jgi:transcriptional regulator with XRE-family HTH domain
VEKKGALGLTSSEKLITLRAGRGWSQEKLAGELGVTRQAVGRWERGECLPDAVGLTGLARVFDVAPEWLLDDAAPDAPEPRRVRRVRLAWFDWLMLALTAAAAIAMLCGLNMDAAERVLHSTYRYPSWTWLPLFLHYFVWFSGGWSAAALIYGFIACPLPLKRSMKRAFIILGAVVAVVFLFSVFVTWGQVLGLADLDIPLWTYLRIIERHGICAVPGVLFSACVKRRAR